MLLLENLQAPGMTEKSIKRLQKKCWRALVLYSDLAESCCAILISSKGKGLTREDAARLAMLSRAESAAESDYLLARRELMSALSVKPRPDDKSAWLAANAKNSAPQSFSHLKP